jgi:hypothetical protein
MLLPVLASLWRSGSFLRQPSPITTTMRPLTLDSLNQQLQTVQYAVRGELAIKAEMYHDQLKSGGHNLPLARSSPRISATCSRRSSTSRGLILHARWVLIDLH